MVKLKIYQINIRGLVSSSIKKDEFRNFVLRGNFDIILVQEWNLNRYNINHLDNNINNTTKKKFPFQLRSDFNIHYQSTETAIIYNKRLNISRINFDFYTNWNGDTDRHKSLMLHVLFYILIIQKSQFYHYIIHPDLILIYYLHNFLIIYQMIIFLLLVVI